MEGLVGEAMVRWKKIFLPFVLFFPEYIRYYVSENTL